MHRTARDRGPMVRVLASLLATCLLLGLAAPAFAADAPPLPTCRYADTMTMHRRYADWHRSLLDTDYRLASTYAPADLRSTQDAGLNGGYKVRKHVLADLKAMAAAARRAGARLSVVSAYRSFATQKATFAYWVDLHGYEYALTESARPGHSEHQLGTTLDFKSYGGPAPWNVSDWAKSKAGAWMQKYAWKYGFVMTYPKGMTDRTCYMYEPWHYRYIGRARAALVRSSGLTLREYLWIEQHQPIGTMETTVAARP